VRKILFSAMYEEPQSEEAMGLEAGARAAMYIFPVPSDSAIRAATIDYADVVDASNEQLKTWFAGKTVVVGDARAVGRDGPYELPGGRRLPGFVGQAAATDAILRNLVVRVPLRLIDVAAAACGAVTAILTSGSARRRRIALVGLSLAGVFLSLVAYWRFSFLCNPLPGIVAMWLAAGLVAWADRARRRAMLIS
jgi:hypothetical protein